MLFSESRAERFELCTWLSDPLFAAWLVEHLQPYGHSICEVGAGTGNMAGRLVHVFAPVFMVEPSPTMSRRMAAKVADSQSPVTLLQAPAEAIPLEAKSVDIALSKSSFHHFANRNQGLSEMARIAKTVIAVAEVVSPDERCLDYARQLVIPKEPGRDVATIFTEDSLCELIRPFCSGHRVLHFDQYIDVGIWLDASELSIERKQELYNLAESQTGVVKEKMQIHVRAGRLVQLRRMALLMGLL